MKHIILLVAMMIATMSYAQNAPIDFETGGNGAVWTWTVFENDTNPPVEIIANPDATGANSSATVAKFTALQAGQPWAGCESMHGSDIGSFSLSTANSTVKIMVWKSVVSDVGIKFVEASGDAQPEIKVANTLVDQWEELTFDFSGQIGAGATGIIDQIVVFPDFELAGRTQDNIVYFDNITFSGGTALAEPTVAALTPTLSSTDVISLFSDAYTDVPVDTWNTPWSVASYEEVLVDGNPTKKYSALDFNGIETVASPIDATTAGMLYFHMDMWTPNSTQFRVVLVDFKGDGYAGANGDTEATIYFDTPAQEEWVKLDIPLADFIAAGMTDQTDINQIIVASQPAGTSAVYLDNVYFSKVPSLGTDNFEISGLNIYPNPTLDVWNVNSDNKIANVMVFDITGKVVLSLTTNANQTKIDASALNTGVYFAKIETAIGAEQIKLIRK